MSKSGILYLFAGLSVISMGVARFLLGVWMPFMWILFGLVFVFIFAGMYLDRETLKDFFAMKTTRHGMSMGTVVILFVALLIGVNFIAVRKYKTFDFSLGKVNTLSDQSIKLLGSLTEDLKVIYFYKKGTEGVEELKRAFIDLLKKYQDQSAFVKLEFVEMNERPDLAKKYDADKGSGLVVVEYKGRKSRIEKIDEQELTNAIVKSFREKDKVVYMTVGHREANIEDSKEATGAAFLKALLEGSRYTVKALNLVEVPAVPDDADIVFVVGPQQNFLDREVKSLENYLKRGGNLVMALEPKTPHGLSPLLASLGLKVKDNYVLKVINSPMGPIVDPQATPVNNFSSQHSITKPFGKTEFIRMRLPTAIVKSEKTPEGFAYDPLLTVDASTGVGFPDLQFSQGQEKGPFDLAYAVKGKMPGSEKEFQAVVFGDAEMMSNQLLYQNLNRDLVLNTVAFLAKEDNLISVTAKEAAVTQMEYTPNKKFLFWIGFILPLPALLLVTSGVLWYRRRYA